MGLPGLFIPILTLFILIFGKIYPQLLLDPTTVPFQEVAIRILASFSYYGGSPGYWLVIVITLSVFGILVSIALVVVPEKAMSIARALIIEVFFLQFFYWVFCMKYSPLYFEDIRSKLIEMNLVLFTGLILASGIFYWICNLYIKKVKYAQDKAVQTINFECPYCHKEYRAVVSYCIACKKHIS